MYKCNERETTITSVYLFSLLNIIYYFFLMIKLLFYFSSSLHVYLINEWENFQCCEIRTRGDFIRTHGSYPGQGPGYPVYTGPPVCSSQQTPHSPLYQCLKTGHRCGASPTECNMYVWKERQEKRQKSFIFVFAVENFACMKMLPLLVKGFKI